MTPCAIEDSRSRNRDRAMLLSAIDGGERDVDETIDYCSAVWQVLSQSTQLYAEITASKSHTKKRRAKPTTKIDGLNFGHPHYFLLAFPLGSENPTAQPHAPR